MGEPEGSILAAKTARKLQLEDGDDDDDVMVISEDSSSLPSYSGASSHQSQHNRSPFRKSPQATSYFQTDSEITARKQLFPSNRSSDQLNSFRFSGSKKLSSLANAGGQSPFTLLDQSQTFVSGTDSKNKKYFVLTKNTEDAEIVSSQESSSLPQTDCIEIDSDQDTGPSSQNSIAETTDSGGTAAKTSSFSYMTSKDFISAHPCTQGQPSVDEKPAVLQRSQSVAEFMLQPARVRATSSPLVDLEDNAPLSNCRGSAIPIPSTNSTLSKVVLAL